MSPPRAAISTTSSLSKAVLGNFRPTANSVQIRHFKQPPKHGGLAPPFSNVVRQILLLDTMADPSSTKFGSPPLFESNELDDWLIQVRGGLPNSDPYFSLSPKTIYLLSRLGGRSLDSTNSNRPSIWDIPSLMTRSQEEKESSEISASGGVEAETLEKTVVDTPGKTEVDTPEEIEAVDAPGEIEVDTPRKIKVDTSGKIEVHALRGAVVDALKMVKVDTSRKAKVDASGQIGAIGNTEMRNDMWAENLGFWFRPSNGFATVPLSRPGVGI